MQRTLTSLSCLVLFAILSSSASAQAPDKITVQGRLTRTGGEPLDSAGVGVVFTLYKGGTDVWTETQSINVGGGVFDVILGLVTPLDTVAFDEPIDLGIKLQNEISEFSPRSSLASSPYALSLRALRIIPASNPTYGNASNLIGGADINILTDDVVGSVIGGGGLTPSLPNKVHSHFATVGGGYFNRAGDSTNSVVATLAATVAGGARNLASGQLSAIGGGILNTAGGLKSVVAGGANNTASGDSSFVGGGAQNEALGERSTIGGGWLNKVEGYDGTIAGGRSNWIQIEGWHSTIGGGVENTNQYDFSVIGGGEENVTNASHATVGGGRRNTASGSRSTVAGGTGNTASGSRSTIGGGTDNLASNQQTSIGGGAINIASGIYATVPGGLSNGARGFASFAAGYQSRAIHNGTFVWQDSTGAVWDTLTTTASNQFLARASGGVAFYSAPAPDLSTGVELTPGSGTWSTLSSVSSKTDFKPIDARDYLERVDQLDVKEWRYKLEDQSVSHVGPMAEDFHAAFGHGPNSRSITTVDADGVALAAIKGLYQIVREQQAEINRLKALISRE